MSQCYCDFDQYVAHVKLNVSVRHASSVVDMPGDNISPATFESHAPYLPVFTVLHILHTPSPTGATHITHKTHFVLQSLPWFRQTIYL